MNESHLVAVANDQAVEMQTRQVERVHLAQMGVALLLPKFVVDDSSRDASLIKGLVERSALEWLNAAEPRAKRSFSSHGSYRSRPSRYTHIICWLYMVLRVLIGSMLEIELPTRWI